jgi:hypothetical protein
MKSSNFTAVLSVLLTLSLSAVNQAGWANEEAPEFSELRVLIEINATDGDAGFQAIVDGDEWKEVMLREPGGMQIYSVKGYGSVREQGLTENFFESAEPSCDEVTLGDFLERFPAGEYLFSGKTIEGEKLAGEAILTHVLPGAPENLAPVGGGVDVNNPVAISWAPGLGLGNCPPYGAVVTIPEPTDLFGYQVVVEREDPEPLAVFTVEMPATADAVTIPAEFLQEDAIYKYEVVVIEGRDNDGELEKGNQTISENFFCTFVPSPAEPCVLPE